MVFAQTGSWPLNMSRQVYFFLQFITNILSKQVHFSKVYDQHYVQTGSFFQGCSDILGIKFPDLQRARLLTSSA